MILQRLAIALILMGALTACGGAGTTASPVDSIPPSETALERSPNTAEPVRRATETAPAPPSSPTSALVPEGAGLASPGFSLVMDTPLEAMPPGEYLIVADFEGDMAAFGYISWDFNRRGRLFHLEPQAGIGQIFGGLVSPATPTLFLDLRDPNGVLLIELENPRLRRFVFGCQGSIRPSYIGERHFTYRCPVDQADPQSDYAWTIVSQEDGRVVGSTVLPRAMYVAGWHDAQLDFVESPDYGVDTVRHCKASAPGWAPTCQALPYWVRTTSLDGVWVWARPTRGDIPLVLLPRSCVDQPERGCAPIPVDPFGGISWSELNTSDLFASWSPEGQRLFVLAACGAGVRESWSWTFSPQTGESEGLLRSPACYQLPYNDVTLWSAEGDRLVVLSGVDGDRPQVISLKGAPEVSELPIEGEVVGLFHVPLP